MRNKKIGFLKDNRLAQRVRDRIRWDKRVSTSDFQIIATNGHITLMGTVDSPARKRAALDVVGNTEGVHSIDDQVLVPSGFHRPDSELKRLVEEQLVEAGIGPTDFISVAVSEGYVKLEGVVHCAEMKARAAGIVWELSGVTDCMNLIEIVSPPQATARAARTIPRKVLESEDHAPPLRQGRIAV